ILSPHTPLAIVGDRTITVADVEQPLTSELHRRQQAIYKLKRLVLDTKIDDILLEIEAQSMGITVDALLDKVRSQISPPAEHIIDHYYDSQLYKQWGSWTGSQEQIKQQIRKHIHTRESNPLVLDYCKKLRQKYPVVDYLTEPRVPGAQLRIGQAPSLGPADASVLVMELSDYHCPTCRAGHKVVKQIKDKYKDKVRWVYKDYPLKKHPVAKELALAARFAHTHGKFWEFQELLFSADHLPTVQDALSYAQELGLNVTLLKQYMSDPDAIQSLEQDVTEIRNAGISSTPTFIINGKLRSGMPTFEEFSTLIDKAIQETAKGKSVE
ncbi:MAG TPA: hypothetical protein DER01_02655, partial [Phycisphaerales bacterium]|nr:hypothetical protein [Phycisphaerales bacterium]